MSNRVTEQEGNLLDSFHDRHEKDVDEELSPMDEDLWIDHGRAIQVTIPKTIVPHSPLHLTQRAQVKYIVDEDLGIHVGQTGIWSRQNDEGNEVD